MLRVDIVYKNSFMAIREAISCLSIYAGRVRLMERVDGPITSLRCSADYLDLLHYEWPMSAVICFRSRDNGWG
jgi:hypothetical protein